MLKASVIGHLGKDAIVNNVNGKNVINFSVAHTEKYKDSQGANVEKTTWVECSYWTDRTAIAPYLQKGTQVYVEGNPEVRVFQRNDNSTGASLVLRVREIQLLGSKKDGPQTQQNSAQPTFTNRPGPTATQAAQSIDEAADDLPF